MQEILLERDLAQVYPLAPFRPGHVAGRDLGQRHEGDPRVAEIGQADGIPGRLRCRRATGDGGGDILADGRHHGFDHVAGLRRTGADGRDLHRGNRDAHAGRVDFRVPRAALVRVDQYEAPRIAQSGHGSHGIHAAEGGQDHAVGKRQFVAAQGLSLVVHFIGKDLSRLDPGDLRVGHPLDVPLAQLRLHQSLAVADAPKAHVADIGLRGDVGHGDPVAELPLPQVRIQDHGELVGRSEAARTRRRADDDGARRLQEFLVAVPGGGGCAWVQIDCVCPSAR